MNFSGLADPEQSGACYQKAFQGNGVGDMGLAYHSTLKGIKYPIHHYYYIIINYVHPTNISSLNRCAAVSAYIFTHLLSSLYPFPSVEKVNGCFVSFLVFVSRDDADS